MGQKEFYGFFNQLVESSLQKEIDAQNLTIDRAQFAALKAGILNRFYGFTKVMVKPLPDEHLYKRDWNYVLSKIAEVEICEWQILKTHDEQLADAIVEKKLEAISKSFNSIARELGISSKKCKQMFNRRFVDQNIAQLPFTVRGYAPTKFTEAELVVYFLNQRNWKPEKIVRDFPRVMLCFLERYFELAVWNRDNREDRYKEYARAFVEEVERQIAGRSGRFHRLMALKKILQDKRSTIIQEANQRPANRRLVHRLIETRNSGITGALKRAEERAKKRANNEA